MVRELLLVSDIDSGEQQKKIYQISNNTTIKLMMLAFGASHECVLEQKMEHNTRSLWDITQNFGIRLDLLGTQEMTFCKMALTSYME